MNLGGLQHKFCQCGRKEPDIRHPSQRRPERFDFCVGRFCEDVCGSVNKGIQAGRRGQSENPVGGSCFNAVNNHRREKVFRQAPRSVNGCKRNRREFVRILKNATSHPSIYII